ncbi:Protein phosphatase 2C [Cynara cardunculus var. scolymus]|uniref:protein-serine/threonine phosphatase n=1 Tax=Cynara cardunculus var. scolymus TaxID=59895 RepID=A0A103XY67_CYNCS|nr:Protein phosphatase 2C [Cynara cardunculus var. scolymus]
MGIYLSSPKTDKTSEDGENEKLRYGVSSMQGWRTSMEDAHAALLDLDNSTSFFGVYDGHGGQAVSKFCAKMDEMMCGQRGWRELAILGNKMDQFSGMIEGLIWSPRGSDLKGLNDNWSTEEGPHSNYDGPTCGSTACVAIIRNNQLVVANAGDSRCVISRKGQAYNLSKDHKPDLEAERERIYKAGGYIHYGRVNGSLNLARAIGDMELKRDKTLPPEKQILTANPDINTVELCEDDDFLVLACDGIWDCMSSQQLVDFVREQLKTIAECCLSVDFDHSGAALNCTLCFGSGNLNLVVFRIENGDNPNAGCVEFVTESYLIIFTFIGTIVVCIQNGVLILLIGT